MTAYQRYRRNIFVKAIIIPLIVTLIFSGALLAVLPEIQDRLPDGTSYEISSKEVQS